MVELPVTVGLWVTSPSPVWLPCSCSTCGTNSLLEFPHLKHLEWFCFPWNPEQHKSVTPLQLKRRELSPMKSNVLLTTATCLVRASIGILMQGHLSLGCMLPCHGLCTEQCTAHRPSWAVLLLPVLVLGNTCRPLAPGTDGE